MGLNQQATGNHAVASIVNAGTLEIGASAEAFGSRAQVGGLINIGIEQRANGADADADSAQRGNHRPQRNRKGDFDRQQQLVDALAQASIVTGIGQQAWGGEAAAVLVSNGSEGLIDVDVSAAAKGSGGGFGFAGASGSSGTSGSSGSSTRRVWGSGADAIAYAQIGNGIIHQQATGFRGAARGPISSITASSTSPWKLRRLRSAGRKRRRTRAAFYGSRPVRGELAVAALSNDGLLDFGATAAAEAGATAIAIGEITGITQDATAHPFGTLAGTASAALTNSGDINIHALAEAVAIGSAYAVANAAGVIQFAGADVSISVESGSGHASVRFDNGAAVEIGALALATGGTGAHATATALGLVQHAISTDASARMSNDGTFVVHATALVHEGPSLAFPAKSSSSVGAVSAIASAVGIAQRVSAVDAHADVLNSGLIAVGALASATASSANAGAYVGLGVGQQGLVVGGAGDFDITNDGAIWLTAEAHALGTDASAGATVAHGLYQTVSGQGTANAAGSIRNDELVSIHAQATASGSDAQAHAQRRRSRSGTISFRRHIPGDDRVGSRPGDDRKYRRHRLFGRSPRDRRGQRHRER